MAVDPQDLDSSCSMERFEIQYCVYPAYENDIGETQDVDVSLVAMSEKDEVHENHEGPH